jgi:hypothetical protein
MTEYLVVKNEMVARATLMVSFLSGLSKTTLLKVRAADELLKLNNDLKEFLILHDFNFLSQSIQKCVLPSSPISISCSVEERSDVEMTTQIAQYDAFRVELDCVISDLDRELGDHFSLQT